ncbi:MAG: hypothetical protein KY455_02030 [Euryarchaeota archaeon]|nr:hypothetical protein [Euryarchaeota archaeon]
MAHRHVLVRSFLLVVLLFAAWPAAYAEASCADAFVVEAPEMADGGGVPFALRLTIPTCLDGHEVRLWVGDTDTAVTRLWNGSAWASPTRYVPLTIFEQDDQGRRIIPLRTADGKEVGEQGTVQLRLRGPDGTGPVRSYGAIVWTENEGGMGTWVEPGAGWAAIEASGRIRTTAPLGVDRDGHPAPPGYAWVSLPPEGGEVARSVARPVAPGDVLFVRVGPDLHPDGAEAVVLWVAPDAKITSLEGLRVSDGEGELVLPDVPVVPGASVLLRTAPDAGHAGAPGAAYTFSWDHPTTAAGLWQTGPFALANGGDDLTLHYGDVLVDAFHYGDALGPGWSGPAAEKNRLEGRLLSRLASGDTFVDTDRAEDWLAPRILRQYQEDRPTRWFDAQGPVRAFVCPDRCLEEVLLRIDGATSTIDVNLYDLTLLEAVEALVAAAERNVTVRVLLQGRPVAASADKLEQTAWAVDRLRSAGVEVRTLERLRFDHDHAKYLVVDGAWTVVLSENANLHGWPPDGVSGNRGWGVAVHDEEVATWMTGLFVADATHPVDSRPLIGEDLDPDVRDPVWAPVPPPAEERLETLVIDGPVRVMPVVAPDHLGDPRSSPLVSALGAAKEEVWTQQLNLPFAWRRPGYDQLSPLVLVLLEQMEQGVKVRGVLSGDFEDGDVQTAGNDETAAVLSRRAAELDHDPYAVPVRLGSGPGGVLHNKGWLVDPVAGGRNLAVVGSANGNLASQTMNREVTLFIEHPTVAAYYRDVLAADLDAADVPPLVIDRDFIDPTRDTTATTPAVPFPFLVSLLGLLVLLGRTRSGPFL